jgi:hypothetical protein
MKTAAAIPFSRRGFYSSYICLTIAESSTDPTAGPVIRFGYYDIAGDQDLIKERRRTSAPPVAA